MGPELLEIQPRDLVFTFEVKKQSSCTVQLANRSDEYVSYKIKTTSPKRYCVRPNTGVILPRSKCEFTVTMQAQRTAPPDMQLKDKFLIQCTVVPFGSADEDIQSSFFSKESGRYVEENKLRVLLVSPPQSPVLQPINGAVKHDMANETPSLKEPAGLKGTPTFRVSLLKEASPMKEIPDFKVHPALKEAYAVEGIPSLKESPASSEASTTEEFPAFKGSPGLKESVAFKESPAQKEAPSLKENLVSNDLALDGVENRAPALVKDTDELKLKITNLESKLNEADKIIETLREEKSLVHQEKDKLKRELVMLRKNTTAKVQVGFPFLFVVFMALIGILIGYKLK